LIIIFLSAIHLGHTQEVQVNETSEKAKKLNHEPSILVEILGQGGFYSLNYDRIYLKNKTPISARFGASVFNLNSKFTLVTPVSFTALYGKQIHYLELGFGISHFYIVDKSLFQQFEDRQVKIAVCPILGYRLQISKAMLFRIVLSPLFTILPSNQIGRTSPYYGYNPWFGVGTGYTFPSKKSK